MDNKSIIKNTVKYLKLDVKVIEFKDTELNGDVDFSYLKKFKQLKKLVVNKNKHLTRIYGLPDSIENLVCNYNTLKYFDSLPSNLKILNCNKNELDNLDNLPANLKILDCACNLIKSLDNLPNSLVYLNCYDCEIENFDNLPNSLEYLNCSNNVCTNLQNLPHNLKYLHCEHNNLNNLDNLPINLIILSCANCNLSSILLPNSLTELVACENEIKELNKFPSNIKYVGLGANNNIKISNLPDSVIYLDIDNCGLEELPILGSKIKNINCSGNKFSQINGKQLPKTVKHLYCMNNEVDLKIFNISQKQKNKIHCSNDFNDKDVVLELNNEESDEDSESETQSENYEILFDKITSKYKKLYYDPDLDSDLKISKTITLSSDDSDSDK